MQYNAIMNKILYLVSLGGLTLAPAAAGSPARSATISKQCVQLQVPVPVVATNYLYAVPRVDSNIDAVNWTVNVTTWSAPNATERIRGRKLVDDMFSISAQLCVPLQKGPRANILQIATQGLGFDKRSVATYPKNLKEQRLTRTCLV